MVSLLVLFAYLIVRPYYKDSYKVLFYISFPALLLMILITASGDLSAAESVGNAVFILLVLLSIDLLITRYIDKSPVKNTVKKKKR